jgi:hypothetical protein
MDKYFVVDNHISSRPTSENTTTTTSTDQSEAVLAKADNPECVIVQGADGQRHGDDVLVAQETGQVPARRQRMPPAADRHQEHEEEVADFPPTQPMPVYEPVEEDEDEEEEEVDVCGTKMDIPVPVAVAEAAVALASMNSS